MECSEIGRAGAEERQTGIENEIKELNAQLATHTAICQSFARLINRGFLYKAYVCTSFSGCIGVRLAGGVANKSLTASGKLPGGFLLPHM